MRRMIMLLSSSSCRTTSTATMFLHKTIFLFPKNPTSLLFCSTTPTKVRRLPKLTCLFHHLLPKFPLASVFTSANAIAAAAAAAGSSPAYATVTSASTHVAVTALAIASGACLSTKVDFLWPKLDDHPDDRASIQVGEDATKRILGGIWHGRSSLEEWVEKALAPSFEELKARIPSSNTETTSVQL